MMSRCSHFATGSDAVSIKLKQICGLLSPKNFPGMAGKPKLVIVQACAGCKCKQYTRFLE